MKTENNPAVSEWFDLALIPFFTMYNVDVIQKCIKIVLNLNLLFIIVRRVRRRGIKWQSDEVFWLGISEKDSVYMSHRLQAKQISGRGNSYPH